MEGEGEKKRGERDACLRSCATTAITAVLYATHLLSPDPGFVR